MATVIGDIISMKVSITSPIANTSNFGVMLIVCDLPKDEVAKQPEMVGKYKGPEEILAAGWKEDEEIYLAASVIFGQDSAPDYIYVAPRQLVNGEVESVVTTLNRAYQTTGWYGIGLAGIPESEYDSIAVWTEATNKMFAFTTSNTICPVITPDLKRTHGWYTNQTGKYDKYLALAIMAVGFAYTPGEETWAFKTLKMVNPSDTSAGKLDTTLADKLDEAHMNYYVKVAGRNITQTGRVLGDEWIDTIRFADWLEDDIQIAIFNAFCTNPKIAFTDKGLDMIEGCIEASLTHGQENGGIAEDSFDDDGNENKATSVYVPSESEVTESERKERVLENVKWSAKLASAIHAVKVQGSLTY